MYSLTYQVLLLTSAANVNPAIPPTTEISPRPNGEIPLWKYNPRRTTWLARDNEVIVQVVLS